MLDERLKTAQKIISIMDTLLKENKMSLVVRNGTPSILDHELSRFYEIRNIITGDVGIDEELTKYLVK